MTSSVNAASSTSVPPAAQNVAPPAQNGVAPAGVAAGGASSIASAAAKPEAAAAKPEAKSEQPKTSILRKTWNLVTLPFVKVWNGFTWILGKIYRPFSPLFKKNELQLMKEELKMVKDGKFAPAEARKKLLKALDEDKIKALFASIGKEEREEKAGRIGIMNLWAKWSNWRTGDKNDINIGKEIFDQSNTLALVLWEKELSAQIAAKEKPKA